MAKILILTDGKAGHENQSRAFARALGLEPALVKVRFRSKAAKALSYALDRLGVRAERLFALSAPLPADVAAVIGTGSGTFYAAKCLARRLGVKCGVVLYPRGYRLDTFDCILAPAFDRPAKAANVIEIPANLVAADAEFYAQGVEAFKAHYAAQCGHALAVPAAVAVIVGGPNPASTMTADWMRRELDAVFAAKGAAEAWVTTSRRTPPEVEQVIDGYPWDYRLIYSREHFNPIPAFVTLAKRLYVTAESTGMLSEACTSGSSEVIALDNLKAGDHKFRRFLESLVKGGYVGGSRKVDLAAQFAAAKARLLGKAAS